MVSARLAGFSEVDIVGAEDIPAELTAPVQAGSVQQQLALLALRIEMAAVYLRLAG